MSSLDDAMMDRGLLSGPRSIKFLTEDDEKAEKKKEEDMAKMEKEILFGGSDKLLAAVNWNSEKKADDEGEAPPAPDNRPLSEILAANAQAKQEDFENTYLKHQPQKGLDDDELEFLNDLEREDKEKREMRKVQDADDMDAFKLAQLTNVKTVLAPEPVTGVKRNFNRAELSKPIKKATKKRFAVIKSSGATAVGESAKSVAKEAVPQGKSDKAIGDDSEEDGGGGGLGLLGAYGSDDDSD